MVPESFPESRPVPQREPAADLLLAEFVRAVAVAWKTLAAYPPGHPVLTGVVENAHRRLAELLASEGPLAIGISRTALLFGETKLDSPRAQQLAQALYARNVAILYIDPGLEPSELESLLRRLAREPHQEEQDPLWDQLAADRVRHVHLRPVDYSSIRMTDEVQPAAEPDSLWDRILRALLAGQELSEGPASQWDSILGAMLAGEPIAPEGPDAASRATLPRSGIASLIAAYVAEADAAPGAGRAPAPWAGAVADAGASAERSGSGESAPRSDVQARPEGEGQGGQGPTAARTGGERPARLSALLTAVESHLATARGPVRVLAARQAAELLRALPPEIRESVLHAAVRVLASDDGAADALQTLSSFAPEAILTVLRRLESEGTKLSRHAFRLTAALSAASSVPRDEIAYAEAPSDVLLAELLALFRDEDIDRFNADDYQALFDRLAVELPDLAPLPVRTPADLGDRVDSLADDELAERLVETLFEMLRRQVPRDGSDALLLRIENLFRLCLTRGRLDQAAGVAEAIRVLSEDPELPPEAHASLRQSLGRMSSMDALAAVLESLAHLAEESVATARRLIERLGPIAVTNLLLALTEEPNRSRRRRIFDLLAALGPAIVDDATRWLSDPRWYVVRNMIGLLRAVGDQASLPEIRRCASHPDPRVRLEALRSLFAFRAAVGADILEKVINDPDDTVTEAVITLVREYRVAEAIDPLVRILTKWDPFGRQRSSRLGALRALGDLAHPDVLPRLSRFFRNWPVPIVAIEERRVAFESLQSYPESAHRPLVQKGLKSRDRAIREICRRLAGRP